MHSTHGRPRSLTDDQVAVIMAWYYAPRSIAEFAKAMKLPQSTVEYCISIRGKYKQASPELRQQALSQRRREVARLRRKGWL